MDVVLGAGSPLLRGILQTMSGDRERKVMEDLRSRLGSNMKLSEKERGCLSIERSWDFSTL